MNVQTETKSMKSITPVEEVREQRTISGIVLAHATRFNHSDSVNTLSGSIGSVTIVPARLTKSGDWEACGEQRPDGFGLAKVMYDAERRRIVQRGFVPMSNVLEVIYGV